MPKPVNPVGPERLAQPLGNSTANCTHRQNSQPYPSPVMQLPIPLASLIRAGVPVTQWGQTVPTVQLSSTSTATTATPPANVSASKSDVIMIDLDELPSPTKPVQEPIPAQANQANLSNDLVRKARNAFPNVSPAFIGMLLNQGNAHRNSQGSQTSSNPQTSTQSGDKEVASSNSGLSDSTPVAENSQTLRGLLATSQPAQEIAEVSCSPTPPVGQDLEMVPDKSDTSPTAPVLQGGTSLDQPGNPTQRHKAEAPSLSTPPSGHDGTTPSDKLDNPAEQDEAEKSSSITPPIGRDGKTSEQQERSKLSSNTQNGSNSSAPQGEGSVDKTPVSGENTVGETSSKDASN